MTPLSAQLSTVSPLRWYPSKFALMNRRSRSCSLRRSKTEEGIFTELAARLDISEDFLRRTLISRPDAVDLISQTQSRGRDPKLEELDGSDPNNFVETLHAQLTSVNRLATTDPLPVFAPTPPWTGGVVTNRDLIPKRSDRERIAKMHRALLSNGVRAWATGARRRRTTPLIMPPSVIDPRFLTGGAHLVLSRPRELRTAR